MRLIDADKLKALYELPESEYYNIPVPVILQNIDDMPTECRWIPVTERCPGMYETVLLAAKMPDDGEYLTYQGGREGKNYKLDGVENSVDYEVHAWMQMPEPYRGRKEE